MKKVETITYLVATIDDMQETLTEAGVPEGYLHISVDIDRFPMSWIRAAYKWIQSINVNQYKDVRRVRALLPDAIWARYKAWDSFNDFPEVVLMFKSLYALRQAVRTNNRPDLFKKGKVNAFIKQLDKKNGKSKKRS